MERLIRNRTLEELVGQVFMVGFEGTRFSSDLSYFLKKLHVGGVIYFKRNVQDPLQLAELSRVLQEKAMEVSSLPLMISVDQEGGSVARLMPPFTRFAAQSEMGAAENPEDRIRQFAQTQAEELRLVGINMNLTPVLDVNLRGAEGLMASRSYGSDPALVSRLGRICITEFQQAGIMACAKHFPGIGDTDLDSHQDLPIQPKDKNELAKMELVPFQAAVQAKTAAIMASHVKYPAYDLKYPASLSEAIIDGLLRHTFGYEGLIMTDDLEMGAVSRHYELEEAIFLAFKAGNDCLLLCHSPEKIERGYQELLRVIKKGMISEEMFKKSLLRILGLKHRFLQTFLPKSNQEIRDYFFLR
jgi:beta-N-acetylhexosaminidase